MTSCLAGLPEEIQFKSFISSSKGMTRIVALVSFLITVSVSEVPSQPQRMNPPLFLITSLNSLYVETL